MSYGNGTSSPRALGEINLASETIGEDFIAEVVDTQYLIAEYDHPQGREEEIEVAEGEVVLLIERTSDDWYYVSKDGTMCGFVAAAFFSDYNGQPPEHLQNCSLVQLADDNYVEEELTTNDTETEPPSVPVILVSSEHIPEQKTVEKETTGTRDLNINIDDVKNRNAMIGEMLKGVLLKQKEFAPTATKFSPRSSSPLSIIHSSPRGTSRDLQKSRETIVREVIATEANYVSILNTLVTNYKQSLLSNVRKYGGNITEKDINIIFGNVTAMFKLHSTLLKEFEFIQRHWKDESTIGDIVIRLAPFLKMYNNYATNIQDSLSLLDNCMKNESFAKIIDQIDGPTNTKLGQLLIMPLQHINQYSSKLMELLKSTNTNHPDHSFITKAIPQITSAADSIHKILEAEPDETSDSKSKNMSTHAAELKAKPNRTLIEEGTFVDVISKKKVALILFNDALACAQESKIKKGNAQEIFTEWPLHLVWIVESTNHKNSFTLLVPTGRYILSAENYSIWMMMIMSATAKHFEALENTLNVSLTQESEANMTIDDPSRFGAFVFNTSQKYVGWWLDGKFDGFGKSEFMGDTYEGSWRNNNRCGQGIMNYSNGDSYNGEWYDDVPEGYGILTYANGGSYKGQWKKGKKEGTGTLETNNGAKYEGQFIADVFCGYGKLTDASGSIYKGNWLNGMRHGNGKYTRGCGDTYNGEWFNDSFNGHGILKYSSGRTYDGNWKDGEYHGKGTLTEKSSTYNGNWMCGRMEGSGVLRFTSGIEYKGSFKKGVYSGNGTITYNSGAVRSYTGEWQNGKKHGSGILQLFNGDVFSGHFRENLIHGSGVYTWQQGTVLKCKWKQGVLENADCTLFVPSKANPTKKLQFVGVYQNGRVVSPTNAFPPITLCTLPTISLLD